jgi:hypothetical protein
MDWNVGSASMIAAAVSSSMNGTHIFGVGSFGGDGSNMGKCFEIGVQGLSRKGLFQVHCIAHFFTNNIDAHRLSIRVVTLVPTSLTCRWVMVGSEYLTGVLHQLPEV